MPLWSTRQSVSRFLFDAAAQEVGFIPFIAPVALVPIDVEHTGGYAITMANSALTDGDTFTVYVGTTGTAADTPCYSGISGQGNTVEVIDGAVTFILPPMVAGTQYLVFLALIAGEGPDELIFEDQLLARPHLYRTGTLGLRRLFSRWLKVGCRDPGLEGPQ